MDKGLAKYPHSPPTQPTGRMRGGQFVQILLILCNLARLAADEDKIRCFSCSSIDKGEYQSQYSSYNFKLTPQYACNDPFPSLIEGDKGFMMSNRVLIERIIDCRSTKFHSDSPQMNVYCFKFVGYVYSNGQNVTARGCYRPPATGVTQPDRSVYYSDNIYIDDPRYKSWTRLRGSLHLCDSDQCNSGNGPMVHPEVFAVTLLSIIHLFA